ncbi:Transcriptional regulator, AcrR family [hydrothermal vent metagenome]|uniref:Transcriptional regulator, AcrR family n=1 Tax=hydrothermal vent metagenome TaxID=652676 RepID=A0A3B0YZA3_9ZZZZ
MNISKREQIINASDKLFYQQGFEHTSFAHIAKVVKISRGNFYYHFKTKDEILDAVISYRLSKTNEMLESWEIKGETPENRIRSFINILVMNRSKIKNYGCPVGTLCSELVKLNHPSLKHANELFTLFRLWLKRQFELLGHKKNADNLAMHLLARSQGIATLSSAFHDEKFIKNEVNDLEIWLSLYVNSTSKSNKAVL